MTTGFINNNIAGGLNKNLEKDSKLEKEQSPHVSTVAQQTEEINVINCNVDGAIVQQKDPTEDIEVINDNIDGVMQQKDLTEVIYDNSQWPLTV